MFIFPTTSLYHNKSKTATLLCWNCGFYLAKDGEILLPLRGFAQLSPTTPASLINFSRARRGDEPFARLPVSATGGGRLAHSLAGKPAREFESLIEEKNTADAKASAVFLRKSSKKVCNHSNTRR